MQEVVQKQYFDFGKRVPPPTTETPLKHFDFGAGKGKIGSGKYVVLVRRQGVFKPVAFATTKEQAFRIGQTKVQNTAAASFKIKTISGKNNTARNLLPVSFYESKKEPGTFIQKRGFRISSAGEKREITMKGIFVNKSRKAKTKMWGI